MGMMTEGARGSLDTLVQQAPRTAELYLTEAVQAIDVQFGGGFAKGHPELVVAFMQICERDFAAASWQKLAEELGPELVGLLGSLVEDRSC